MITTDLQYNFYPYFHWKKDLEDNWLCYRIVWILKTTHSVEGNDEKMLLDYYPSVPLKEDEIEQAKEVLGLGVGLGEEPKNIFEPEDVGV